MKIYDGKSTVLEFRHEPREIDLGKELEWFLESFPTRSNKGDVSQYMDVLISSEKPVHRYDPAIICSSDVGKTL